MSDVRKLLKTAKASSRISHPYAAYTGRGELICSLCSLPVKNDVLWPSHLNSKNHRNRVREKEEQERIAKAGEKRPADDIEEPTDAEAGSNKRARIDESPGEDEITPEVPKAATSFLPADFFDDPSKTPLVQPAQQEEDDDEEWAAFEATLAQPEASTSEAGIDPSMYAAASGATITAQEVLFEDGVDENAGKQNGSEGEEEEGPKETEEEKAAREEREELMERIDTEEREQQEADERVDVLKKRLEAIRAAKSRAGASKGSNEKPENSAPVAGSNEMVNISEAKQRRNRRLKR